MVRRYLSSNAQETSIDSQSSSRNYLVLIVSPSLLPLCALILFTKFTTTNSKGKRVIVYDRPCSFSDRAKVQYIVDKFMRGRPNRGMCGDSKIAQMGRDAD